MKRKSMSVKIMALCLVCFIFVTPLTINAVDYSVNEDGTVMAGLPEEDRIYTIYTQSGRAFDVMNGKFDENSTVWTYPYNGDKCQEWKFIKIGSYYVIQDTNSQKYLTVLDNSSAENAQIVIRSMPTTGATSGQMFSVQQIGTSMRYRIFTKSSNNTLAIGYDSSNYLRQMPASQTSTQIYFEESAVYHGLREGYVHIQEYNSSYATNDLFLGVDYMAQDLWAMQYSNSANFRWEVTYLGGGCFSFNNNDAYLSSPWSNIGSIVNTSTYNENTCRWRVIKADDYYQLVPASAYSESNDTVTISAYLGLSGETPALVNAVNSSRKWRIIRSHHYYNYDLSMYVMEDDSHSDTHAYIFDYVCSALYVKGYDNQNLHYEVDEVIDIDADDNGSVIDDITHMIDASNLFIIYAHGSPDGSSITLNAKNAYGNNKGTTVSYNRSNITSLSENSLDSLGCAIFFSCHSAQGMYENENSNNFVNAVIAKGAQSAIGFDGTVSCDDIEEFSLKFFSQYSNMVGSVSARALESYRVAINNMQAWNADDFNPYFTNGYVDYQDQIP